MPQSTTYTEFTLAYTLKKKAHNGNGHRIRNLSFHKLLNFHMAGAMAMQNISKICMEQILKGKQKTTHLFTTNPMAAFTSESHHKTT